MKNKMRKRVMAGSMAAVLTAVGVGAYGFEQDSMSEVEAKDEDTETLKEAAESALGDTTTGSDGELYKDESVYVNADASGKVTNTTVTEWLKNPEKGTVSDETTLKDVKNVKGNEKYKEGSGDTIDWKSKGKDIYYQGTTDAELPVDMDITYKLNGKEISPEDLAGKNGKLEMTINYENKSKQEVEVDGEKTEMYTPFTVATAMMLSTDEYTNVTIDNGKIVSDGDKNIVVGIAFPGLSEDLGLEDSDLDIDIPDSVTITADVTDVSVGATYTLASANLLDSIGLDDVDSFDDLDDSIDKLKDATNQLVDGSKELADGSKTLADGTKTLSSGAKSLADGNKQLADGTSTLNSKSGDLISGVNTLADGVTAYTGGVASLADGASALYTGSTGILSGIQSAEQGAANLLAAYAGDGTATNPGADNLLAKTQDTIEKASGAVSTAATNSTDAKNNATAAATSAGTAAGQIAAAVNSVNNAKVSSATVSGKDAALAAVNNAIGLSETDKQAIVDAINNISASSDNTTAITEAQAALNEAANNATAAVTSAKAAATNAGTAEGYLGDKGATAALNGASQYATGLGQTMAAMKEGTKTLQYSLGNNGTKEKPMLGKAALLLQAGAKELTEGSAYLNQQSSVLNTGMSTLKNGGAQLASGVSQLASGAYTAANGANTLANGTDTLVSGADTLASGADTLASGMSEYKTDAIDKLTDIFDGDIGKVTSRIDTMKDLSANYKSFAGIKDGMNGSTKFIIETEGVDK